MRVIDTPDISTIYTIHIQRQPGGGGFCDYYYSNDGFSIFNPTNFYGLYDCTTI